MNILAGPSAVAIAFWVFVAVAVVAGIVGDYKKRKLAIEPLLRAIEKGQHLDPALVAKLMSRDGNGGQVNAEDLQVGGIITTAAGTGVALLSLFLAQLAPRALYPIMGAGVVTICVGVGLLVAVPVIRRARAKAASAGLTDVDRHE
jgi:hypothetical protein